MTDIFAALAAPFHPDKVSWRVGSTTQDKKKGMALAYIDARDVLERLDSVVGPANWQNRYPHAGTKTCCEIGIRIDGEWIWKANGAGDSDHEAEKGAFSDGFKRAGVCWGIGRYLYDIASPWVEIEPAGKSFKIKQDQYRILRRALGEASAEPAPQQPAPARQQAPKQQPAADAPPVKAAYIIARGGKIGDWMDRLAALVSGAPDAATIKDIEDANKAALDDMRAKAPAQHQRAMQILSRATTDILNRSEAA